MYIFYDLKWISNSFWNEKVDRLVILNSESSVIPIHLSLFLIQISKNVTCVLLEYLFSKC